MNAAGGIRAMDPDLVPHATWITTCQQTGPRRTANRGRGIVIREPNALSGHAIDSRCIDLASPIATEIIITLIINKDEYDIGLCDGGKGGHAKPTNQATYKEKEFLHLATIIQVIYYITPDQPTFGQ
jgi:hypothetical protein